MPTFRGPIDYAVDVLKRQKGDPRSEDGPWRNAERHIWDAWEADGKQNRDLADAAILVADAAHDPHHPLRALV